MACIIISLLQDKKQHLCPFSPLLWKVIQIVKELVQMTLIVTE